MLGSVSIAGAVQMEVKGKVFSNGLEKVRAFVAEIFTHRADLSSAVSAGDTFKFFKDISSAISYGAQEAWKFITETLVPHITSINVKHLDPIYSIQNFLKSLVDPNIFHRIFENLHLKIWNVFSFSLSGHKRNSFLSLFESKNRDSSLKAVKFLLGLTIDGNNNFKAKSHVFNYLLLKWMDDPDRVTEKFKRLSETIDSWSKKFSSSSSGGGKGAGGQSYVYELDIETVEEYLNVPDGWSETLYKTIWAGEILTKIKTGQDLTFGSKSWILNLNKK